MSKTDLLHSADVDRGRVSGGGGWWYAGTGGVKSVTEVTVLAEKGPAPGYTS